MSKAFKIEVSLNQKSNPDKVPSPEPPAWVDALKGRVDKVKQNHSPVLQGQESPISETEDMEGNKKEIGLYRFSDEDDKETMLDEIEDKVVKDGEWYKISYHECEHEKPVEERTGCGSWVVEREKK